MIGVLRDSWPLFLGIGFLMLGNGLQGSLLGVRGSLEAFSPELMGYVMSAYFVGLILGSWATPIMLRRVGHIRVFAALASLISAAFIIYAAVVDPIVWFVMRALVGFCFSGVYIVAESWLNDASTNENRGQTLSAYMMVQMSGIVAGQLMLNAGDPKEYELFVLISVLVSVSFAPILLSVSPAPVYQTSKPMSVVELFRSSPLGMVGSFFLGGAFGALFGMGSVYGTEIGLSVFEISILLAAIYGGGTFFQYPIGWLSDRMDRRYLIIGTSLAALASAGVAILFWPIIVLVIGEFHLRVLYVAGFLLGGFGNPLYSLLAAHTNDFIEREQMASASGSLVLANGVGAMLGPVVTGLLMGPLGFGPIGWWLFLAAMFGGIAAYGLYRATQRPTVSVDETGPYAPIGPAVSVTPIAAEIIQEVAYERMDADLVEAAREPREVLAFWLDEVGEDGWWRADPALDAKIEEKFASTHVAAAAGSLDDWAETPEGALALVIVLDQFSRNLYRDDARAFAYDEKAKAVAEAAIEKDFDLEVAGKGRPFFYLPFEHSEDLADQDRCVDLFKERQPENATGLHHAEAHRDLIRLFGRFPHRNEALGRETTPEEAAHLAKGGYQPGKALTPEDAAS